MAIQRINNLLDVIDRRDWRIIGMLTEEAGEVQGAFNKYMSAHPTKHMTQNDVIEELVQLGACCYIAAVHFGLSTDYYERCMQAFVDEKAVTLAKWRDSRRENARDRD